MRQALELALEALKRATNYDPVIARAITAIKEALAQPEQEPVGQLLENAFGRGQVMWFNKPKDESMLYTTPPQRTWVGLTQDGLVTSTIEEEEAFNDIERTSKIKQEIIRNPSKEAQLIAEVAILTETVRVLADRIKELESK